LPATLARAFCFRISPAIAFAVGLQQAVGHHVQRRDEYEPRGARGAASGETPGSHGAADLLSALCPSPVLVLTLRRSPALLILTTEPSWLGISRTLEASVF